MCAKLFATGIYIGVTLLRDETPGVVNGIVHYSFIGGNTPIKQKNKKKI